MAGNPNQPREYDAVMGLSKVNAVTFSPDGQTLASASSDETIKLWKFSTGELLYTIKGHSAEVTAIAFSPDGRTLVSGAADGTIKLWDGW